MEDSDYDYDKTRTRQAKKYVKVSERSSKSEREMELLHDNIFIFSRAEKHDLQRLYLVKKDQELKEMIIGFDGERNFEKKELQYRGYSYHQNKMGHPWWEHIPCIR